MKKAIKSILFVLSAACFLLNIGPVVTNRQINVGIIVGLGASALFLIYGILFEKINGIIGRILKVKSGKIIISLIAVCLVCGIAVGGFAFVNIVRCGIESDVKTDYVIVLGCQVRGTQPGIYLRGRINKAYEYLTENPKSKAILSGGQGDAEDISEGQCMYNCLTEMGIDGSRLIIEDESASTIENFDNSIRKLRESGIDIKEITIVTNDFHEYRASSFAKKNGLTAYSFPSKSHWTGYLPFAVREVFAVVVQVYLDIAFTRATLRGA